MSTNKRFKDLSGLKNGRLTVLRFYGKGAHSHNLWLCRCECGAEKIVSTGDLKKTHSCGCLARELTIKRNTTHGNSKHHLYRTWHHMCDRCGNPNNAAYKNYGGRGITVCSEWRENFAAFYEWSMTHDYKDGLTIDRIDVNGNYEPSNCRYVGTVIQSNNRRNNIFITYNGVTQTLAQWCKDLGLDYLKTYRAYRKNVPLSKLFGSDK